MKQKEMVWRINRKLSDLEEVAKERAQNLLQRADKLRMEQEEELKHMSKVGVSISLPLSPSSPSHTGQGEEIVGAGWWRVELGNGGKLYLPR